MSAGHSEPQVLYSVNNIRAYHVQDGEEHSLTPSGPQTLSLLMVPTASPFSDPSNTDPGQHGYDPRLVPDMKAIFLAAGPDIRAGVTLRPFENVDVYPLIAKILGLPTGKIDGRLRALQGILRKSSAN